MIVPVMFQRLIVLPIHNGDEGEYQSLAARFQATIRNLSEKYIQGAVDERFPGHFFNDIAGFVEVGTDGEALYCTIYARKTWSGARWKKDRRIVRGRMYYCDTQHVSLRRCSSRKDYANQAQLLLQIAGANIPEQFSFDPSFAEPVFRNLDWRRLLKTIDA